MLTYVLGTWFFVEMGDMSGSMQIGWSAAHSECCHENTMGKPAEGLTLHPELGRLPNWQLSFLVPQQQLEAGRHLARSLSPHIVEQDTQKGTQLQQHNMDESPCPLPPQGVISPNHSHRST